MEAAACDISALLRSQPHRWARIKSYTMINSARSRAKTIRQGLTQAFAPAGEFQASVRRVASDEYLLYARYVGSNPVEADTITIPDGFRFIEELPTPGSRVVEQNYQSMAENLKLHPGGKHVLQSGLSARQAQRLASRVRRGEISSFAPAGEFAAEVVQDTDSTYAVLINSRRLIVPLIQCENTHETIAGWLAGVAWFQENGSKQRSDLQAEVDQNVKKYKQLSNK